MDDPGRQVIMGPPAAVATASNQPGPGNPSSAPPPQVTKGAPPPKRIIKKVQLDFNKLKEAGLDRQLAEVLRNQKLGDRKVETPSSSIPSPSAAAQSTSNAAECKLHQPQQQFRQPAPQPLVKRFMISEFIEKTVPIQTTPNPTVYNTSNANRSMHVKTLLKNRILNKNTTINSQPQQMATTSQAASLSSAQGSASRGAASPAAFSMPIAKADLTIRPKQQPLLLNLVNQLPKHRAMCGPSYKSLMKQQHTPGQQISPNPQRIAAQQPIQISTQLQPQHPFQPAPEVPVDQSVSVVSPRLHKSPSPPLIVLENKVLAPNEKIDLSGLRLPNAPVPTTLSQAKPSETPVQTNLQSKIIKGKVIMNANKFKVSREKLAEMAKEIRQQANQNDLTSKLNEFSEKSSSESSCLASTEIKSPVKKVQTAVDFIAQLAAENPLDESAFMDLSPEEQRLNALFGGGEYMGMSPVNEPAQPEEELPIGKIVQMDNMNILHATLDVHSDSTNVLRISPNALRLQSSGSILEKSLVDIEGVTDSVVEEKKEQVNLPEPPAEVATKPSVVKSLVFDTLETPNQEPQEDARSTVINTNNLKNDPNPKLNESEVPLEEIKPVSDAELVQEVNPPVKRSTIRSKKAKINLVQRTKRPSIPKAIEAKKTKIDFEEGEEEAMATDHSLLDDRYGVAGVEVIHNSVSLSSDKVNPNLSSVKNNPKVPADEKQNEEDASESREDDTSKETSPSQDDPAKIANVGGRIPTSSTSDDDGSIFLGFDNKAENRSKTPMRSNRVRQMKINETDISDDATPDYDETEEEQQSTKKQTPEKNSEIAVVEAQPVQWTLGTTYRLMKTERVNEMISPKPEEPKVPAKRGRKRAAPVETEADSAKKLKTEESSETVSIVDFNLRLLLIRKREQLDTEEDVTENGKGEGPLQCGLCMMRCDKKNWHSHLGEHYGVGWTVGNTPKKITRASVMKMMKNHLQNSAEKLTCRLCNHQLGTPLGMLLHLEGCGNKQRIACDFCNRCYTKLSLPGHIRTCPKRQVHQNEDDQEPADGVVAETVYSNAGRAKRKSTIKAETKLKKIGEELTSQKATEETTAKHDFDGDSSDYDMAKDNESSEEYDSEGADSNEDALSTEDEDSLADNKRNEQGHVNRKRKTKRAVNTGECQQKPLLSRYHHLEARATHKWKEFVQRNYKAGSLFSQFLPSYSKVSAEEASFLLPSKETTSIRYAYGKVSKEDDWKQLAPLEGFNKKGEYVGYLGRPIKQLAWVPLPPKITDQYLLCNLRPKMKTFARHTQLKDEEALLMLLKCTVLSDNSDDKSWGLRPELHYGIRVPNGPVHSFSFLPSGGYDKSSNRLGLLAVGSSLSDVHIYALPLELTEEESAGDKVIIQLESLITLSLDVNNPVRDQCTKVCWSQASGHTFLATGYGNGNIAFWDIGDTDNINCFKRNNQTYFVPLTYFYIGERNVQFMDIHYDKNGPRWLAVGTSIRQFMIYDIANWSQPVVLTQDTICTLYMANMTWSPICETLVVSSSRKLSFFNQSEHILIRYYFADFNRTIAVSPSGIQFEHRTLDGTLTTTREMHTNCQQNHMVFVTDNGDLVFLDVRDLNCGPALLKSVTNRRVVSTTELHHLGANAPKAKDPINADEFLRDYGVQINPLVPAPHRKKSFYLDAKRRPQNVHTLALSRFNCVRCNWNSPAHTWVAMGAEHGLLRILNFDRDKFF
ncbi:hypothetical protein M5D96_006021 [Drosophila gunungcola]|uniref:Uncharacterized protein n=1 Tax=Drosophila gunungcola TaxID=103775 RepID=A0A9Q0BRB7_9MUSC|nr:hypothetical protein M5D96_006021 [Drosophila gunungcola]